MSDYEVGYQKPPKDSRFKAGVSGNPKGRGKRKHLKEREVLLRVLSTPIQFRDRGRIKKGTLNEALIRKHVALALKGDIGSAGLLLRLRAHVKEHGDYGPTIIRITGGFPDRSREQKE
jgi:hypothetical protein